MPTPSAPPDQPPETERKAPEGEEPVATGTEEAALPEGTVTRDFILDGLVDVGPSGPATASVHGVVMVNRADDAFVAKLGALGRSSAPEPSPITGLGNDTGPYPLARGPAVFRDHAYWASKGSLLRRKLLPDGSVGPIEVIARDARPGARVAIPRGPRDIVSKLPSVVGYVADPPQKDGPLRAKLWFDGGPSLTVTPEAASALSLALVARRGSLTVLSLEGRTGMSTVHARRVSFTPGQEPSLGPDAVVWVGGSAQPLSEVIAGDEPAEPRAFLALERDITRFGLLTLSLRDLGEAQVSWYDYANGLDPAPLAAGEVCGKRVLLRAEPARSAPGSPQQLLLSEQGKPEASLAVLARSKAFFDASLSELPGGALLTYVADRRTWARTLRCASTLPPPPSATPILRPVPSSAPRGTPASNPVAPLPQSPSTAPKTPSPEK